ncbi:MULTISPECIES: ion channel [unclassified Nocardioides]|uniref:ion channel n=1 Tax=unclassified Nocardioides TaxID=2615069 RepID=UPI00266525EF|nr:potassium channel family protein [Nocardioides sp. Arc9.136]WKN50269.1 potassium channel family protein [Nocardioides sp. Arc9.136]
MTRSADQQRVHGVLGRHPSAVLLGVQLLAVLAYPFLQGSTVGRAVIGIVQIAVVTIAVWAVRRTPALSWSAAFLGIPAMVFTILEAFSPDTDWIVLTSALLHAPFYFYVSYALIRYLFHDDRVTTDELYATGAAFTVVAWGFAYLYAAVQVIFDGAFIGTDSADTRSWFELLYLSFSVLTSVGLSDVVPVEPHARSLVMVEMVAGVLYVALVVARLVGLIVTRQATAGIRSGDAAAADED